MDLWDPLELLVSLERTVKMVKPVSRALVATVVPRVFVVLLDPLVLRA